MNNFVFRTMSTYYVILRTSNYCLLPVRNRFFGVFVLINVFRSLAVQTQLYTEYEEKTFGHHYRTATQVHRLALNRVRGKTRRETNFIRKLISEEKSSYVSSASVINISTTTDRPVKYGVR